MPNARAKRGLVCWIVALALLAIAYTTYRALPTTASCRDAILGIGCSLVAALLIWSVWWLRLFYAAGTYCGTWKQFDLEDRQLVDNGRNATATIHRAFTCCPCSWLSPENLVFESAYDGSPEEGRVEYNGKITINPIAANRAFATLERVGSKKEFAVQEYFQMRNGDIYVVPAVSGKPSPDYHKHVLQRSSR